ncbi:MAG: protein-glutamate O-methyltransferase CheR [Gemmatimonadetes bacterium]|nr:protein-glutamate O-methyltransferase CheR [Gemmatimonadota bacterium]
MQVAAGAATAAPTRIRALTAREFAAFQALIYAEAGIRLNPGKEALLVGRLTRRVRALGLDSFGAYHQVVSADAAERTRMLEAVCTHETHFFREPAHFHLLERTVLPGWRRAAAAGERPKRVRAWSAAASSGEEPYTLSMVLDHHLPASEGWDVEVLATDLSAAVLEQARTGLYAADKAREIPSPYLKKYMLRGTRTQEGRMKVGPEARRPVRFARVNLNEERWPVPGRFDLVFCRNVLIYFDRASRAAVIDRLLDRLEPGGLLFLGHAESLNGITARVRTVAPTVYALRDGAAA